MRRNEIYCDRGRRKGRESILCRGRECMMTEEEGKEGRVLYEEDGKVLGGRECLMTEEEGKEGESMIKKE